MTNSRRKRKQKRNGRICISLIAIMFLVIMSVQIVKLYQKEQEYTAREKALTESLEDETERQNQLDNYEMCIRDRLLDVVIEEPEKNTKEYLTGYTLKNLFI